MARDGNITTRLHDGGTESDTDRLARAFNAALAHVEVMYRALEQVVVKQRRFVADASHELRTPLTTISSCLELLTHFPGMPEDQRDTVLGDAHHETRQMARLVDDLLTLAAMDSGERLARGPLSWTAFLQEVTTTLGEAVAPRTLTVDLAPGLGDGSGDARALTQLFGILGANIAEHTGEDAAVSLSARRREGAVEIVLADSGVGVPEEMRERIFERFVRVDASRHGAAIGLGLSIARAIVAGHGGTIVAENAQPHGLRMVLVFPPVSATPERRRAPRPATPPPGADASSA